MRHPSRLTARLALDAETAKAAAEVTRWVRVVERMGAAGEPTRVARRFLRAARDELDRLDRVRDALPSGDEWRGEAEEVKTEEA